MLDDLRFALRSLGRSKVLTTVLLVSLALGTGANAAVCGIVYALLLQPPAGVDDPGDLLSIYTAEFSGYLAAQAINGLLRSDLMLLARTPVLLAIAVAAVVPLRRALSVNPATALGLRT